MSSPEITSPIFDGRDPPLIVRSSSILRFGVLEREIHVDGERVVYDPQAGTEAKPFHENGSKASKLAIVGNQIEIAALGREKDIERAASRVLRNSKASVVVVKRGANGALVLTQRAKKWIPSFRTPFVWPIGSGDIFAGVFARLWAERNFDPVRAAMAASRAVAYYCWKRTLPLPTDLVIRSAIREQVVIRRRANVRRAYLAGPFFNHSQLWMIQEARTALQDSGLKVFSPFHDVGFGGAATVVPADLRAIRNSDVLFAIVEGLDSGTLFEIGYARALGIPVVAFVETSSLDALKMLEGTSCRINTDFATAIYEAAWTAFER
jgi:nucleoside 2-deoxyribosyltransferase